MPVLKIVRLVAWAAVAVLAIAAGLGALGYRLGLPDPARMPLAASIGGPFSLVAQDGRRFTDKDLAGKPYAIFFGFTHCPDVCPTTLLELSNRMTELGPLADRLRLVFVTVDPERDRPEDLARYVGSFDKRIVALTGTPAEIAEVARVYRIVYERVATKDAYTMNHTASVYLMDAKGGFAGTIAYQEKPAVQLEKLRRLAAGGG